VICTRNSSIAVYRVLRERGYEAFSVIGSWRWETVYWHGAWRRPRPCARREPTGRPVRELRLVSDGDAVLWTRAGRGPVRRGAAEFGRRRRRYDCTPTTSAGPRGGRAVAVPYFRACGDAIFRTMARRGDSLIKRWSDGDTIVFGRATPARGSLPAHPSQRRVVADEDWLTGDFLFVRSVGRPDWGPGRDVGEAAGRASSGAPRMAGTCWCCPAHYRARRNAAPIAPSPPASMSSRDHDADGSRMSAIPPLGRPHQTNGRPRPYRTIKRDFEAAGRVDADSLQRKERDTHPTLAAQIRSLHRRYAGARGW